MRPAILDLKGALATGLVLIAGVVLFNPTPAVAQQGGEPDEVQAVTASSMPRPAVAKRDIGRWYVAVVELGGHWATFIAVPTGR